METSTETKQKGLFRDIIEWIVILVSSFLIGSVVIIAGASAAYLTRDYWIAIFLIAVFIVVSTFLGVLVIAAILDTYDKVKKRNSPKV